MVEKEELNLARLEVESQKHRRQQEKLACEQMVQIRMEAERQKQ